MIYVISDLHGYPVEKLKKLLASAGFGDDDYLYILGDVVDRNGDGGVSVLCWLLSQPNVELLLGNHEAMLLACDFVFEEVTEAGIDQLDPERMGVLNTYIYNGGDVTLRALHELDKETQAELLDYLRDCPLYEAVTAGDKDYILVHSGFSNFSKTRKISEYTPDELLWARPGRDTVYFDEIHTVFGHTPTGEIDCEYDGRIYKTATWTCIDCGVTSGNEPILLRLDDYREFKLEE